MKKLPTTSGGAAGSFVRGNEFYRDSPTAFSSTRRGSDVIRVSPGRIDVTRNRAEPYTHPPHLFASLRYSLDELISSYAFQYQASGNIIPLYATRRLCGWSIASEVADGDATANIEQRYLWESANIVDDIGRLTYVGDGYFTALGASNEPRYIGESQIIRSRVYLIHRDNIGGPFIDSRLRYVDTSPTNPSLAGSTHTAFRKVLKVRTGEKQRDVRGANYLLRDTLDTLFRIVTDGNLYTAGRGAGVSVIPLGWYDPTHRYIFAVFGLSRKDAAGTKYNCHVYSTGTRDLLHSITQLPDPPAGAGRGEFWVGMMGTSKSIPRMTSIARGTAAAVFLPTSKVSDAPTMGDGVNRYFGHVTIDVDPVLMYTTTFGHNWFTRPLPELRALALPTPITALNQPRQGLYYPELCAQICPLGERRFLLLAAQLKRPLDGPVPNPTVRSALEAHLASGSNPRVGLEWYPSAGTGTVFARSATMTLFSGTIEGGIDRITSIDGAEIYHFDPAFSLEQLEPPGRYRYRLLLNSDAESPTPCIAPIGVNAAAMVVRTLDLEIPDYGGGANRAGAKHSHVRTDMMVTLDGGATWKVAPLPAVLLSYRDEAATARGIQLGLGHEAISESHPARDFVSWCVVRPNKAPTVSMTLAFCVEQMDESHVYLAKFRELPSGDITVSTRRVGGRKGVPPLMPPGVNQSGLSYMWDYSQRGVPSGVMLIGNERSKLPDVPVPAIPQLLK